MKSKGADLRLRLPTDSRVRSAGMAQPTGASWARFDLHGEERDLIPADAINELTGTVYVPNAKLIISGTTKLAQTSPWTVIVAKGLNPNQHG